MSYQIWCVNPLACKSFIYNSGINGDECFLEIRVSQCQGYNALFNAAHLKSVFKKDFRFSFRNLSNDNWQFFPFISFVFLSDSFQIFSHPLGSIAPSPIFNNIPTFPFSVLLSDNPEHSQTYLDITNILSLLVP